MKVSDLAWQVMEQRKISPADRFVLLDCIRRSCAAQRVDELSTGGSQIPVRLKWRPGVGSCGLSRDGYRIARKRLVAAGLLDRCRDSDRVGKDGRPQVMRDWFVVKLG